MKLPGQRKSAIYRARKPTRLRKFDYSRPGAYFVTVCVQGRACLFGEIVGEVMRPNDIGRMVRAVWGELPQHFPGIGPDEFVVMPNHVHGIILLGSALDVGAPLVGARTGAGTRPAPTLGSIVGAFKSLSTNGYIRGVKEFGWPAFDGKLWQRNYYEHIIRNEHELNSTREYIENNPLQWALDRENPQMYLGAGDAQYRNVFGNELP